MGTTSIPEPRAHAVTRLVATLVGEPIAWRRADLMTRWSDHTVNAAVHAGTITRVAPAIYVATSRLAETEWRASAAALWVGSSGAVSGAAALWLHGIARAAPNVVTVAAPHRFKRTPLPYVRLRRTTVPFTVEVARGTPVTPVADALIHAWEELPARNRVGAVLDALRDGRTDASIISERLLAYPRVRGRRALTRLLGEADGGATSYLEHRAHTRVFHTTEFAGLEWQVPIAARGRRYILDAFDRRSRLAIEFDGRAFHSDDASRRRDLRRDADLATIGIQTLRFTFEDVVQRPRWCRGTVRGAVRTRVPRT